MQEAVPPVLADWRELDRLMGIRLVVEEGWVT
jgi:hypothetical protein